MQVERGERFWRTTALVAVALCVVLTSERMLRSYLLSADAPREVAVRGDLGASEKATAELFRVTAPSVASIYTLRGAGRLGDQESGAGTGSGFVWDRAGHVVTNNHVIEGASEIGVVLDNGRMIPARLVGQAPWADLAVLKLTVAPDDLRPIPVGRSKDLVVGQAVLAIGNPFGLSGTLTTGIISALDRRLPTPTGRIVTGVIQTDAAINPGNSGGPLIDSAGRLIGVNTAIAGPSGASAGVGFAIPVDTVNRIVPALIRDGRVPLAGIGIVPVPEEIAMRAGVRGLVIQSVRPGSSAETAGLRGLDSRGRVGDVILEVGGTAVASVGELSLALEQAGIGNTARLTVVREGRRRSVDVKVQDING